MAKVVMTFDTESKECSVTVNGVEQPDLNYVSVYKGKDYDPELTMEFSKKTEDGMSVYTTARANEIEGKDKINLIKNDNSLFAITDETLLELDLKDFVK